MLTWSWAPISALEQLLDGPQRYGDLQRDLGAPTNMLATRLRELQAAGVLTRLPLRHNIRAYALTDRGLALREAITALGRWGTRARVPPGALCPCRGGMCERVLPPGAAAVLESGR